MRKPHREPLLSPQLPLDLKRRTHGGARPGAGRPPKAAKDRGMVHAPRPKHRKGDPVHVTLKVTRNLPSLRRQVLEQIVKRALLTQRKKLADDGAKEFQVVHFTIQSDHLHLIVEADHKGALARGVMGLEIRIARRINKALRRKGRFWADRYHRRDLGSPPDVRNVLRYVLLNIQKHHCIIGDRCFADPASSAPTFDGFARPPAIFDDPLRWPRVDPRTWLLGTGWLEYGRIDPAEIPSSSPHRAHGVCRR